MSEVDKIKTDLSTVELRRLLIELKEKQSNVHVRFRLIGQMWKPNFMKMVALTDQGLVMVDEVDSTLTFLTDLSRVMQFELDAAFQGFHPYFHYSVHPHLD